MRLCAAYYTQTSEHRSVKEVEIAIQFNGLVATSFSKCTLAHSFSHTRSLLAVVLFLNISQATITVLIILRKHTHTHAPAPHQEKTNKSTHNHTMHTHTHTLMLEIVLLRFHPAPKRIPYKSLSDVRTQINEYLYKHFHKLKIYLNCVRFWLDGWWFLLLLFFPPSLQRQGFLP